MNLISVVVPVYNEVDNVERLVNAVDDALKPSGTPFELILTDDGSRDGTNQKMLQLAESRPWLRCLLLARNYGQSTALQAGFDHARGDCVVTLDGDLQNDPRDIPMMVETLDKNPEIDCVSGWRKARQDAALSRLLPSKLANALISRVTKVQLNDYGCALKVYRASIISNLRLYGELHRFIPALAVEAGARIVEIPVRHHARTAGVSKYGIDRTIRVLLDLLWIRFTMRFLHRPIHAFGGVALLLLTVGIALLAYLGFDKLVLGSDIGSRPLLMFSVLLTLVGVQLLAAGLIGELLIRIYHEPQGRRQYILRPSRSDSAPN